MSDNEGRLRPKYLRLGEGVGRSMTGAADNDTAPAVTLTRGELSALVRAVVADALETERAAQKPALLDREALDLQHCLVRAAV